MNDVVPAALRERHQWVVWRDEHGRKVPYATSGKKASSTDSASWSAYSEACEAAARGKYSGVGFVFAADDPFAGIDLDDCIAGDTVAPWAQEILDACASYAEISPSGAGVKIFVEGELPGSVKTKHIELYDRGRYFTVTGRKIGAWSTVQPAQPVLDRLAQQLRASDAPPVGSYVAGTPPAEHVREWGQRLIAQEIARVAMAPDGEKHNTRFAAARLLGGLIPHGITTAAELESLLFAAQQPKTEAARSERKTIRDGLQRGAQAPLEIPPPPPQPVFDRDGYACCPTHTTRLEPAKNGNGWRCAVYDCFWWKGEGYTAPGPVVPGTYGLKVERRISKGEQAAASAERDTEWQRRGIRASELQSRTFETMHWPVASILPEGCTLLAGKPKTRKSWLALGLAVDVALGHLTLGGLETRRGHVLYLDLESNQRRMQARLRAMLGTTGWPDNLHIFTEWPRGAAGIVQLDDWIAVYQDTSLVIADILQNIRPARVKNANPYDEDYEAVKPLTAWGEKHHAGVLALHHTRKAKADDVFDEISGSTGLVAGAAGMWILGRMPNSTEYVLTVRGRDIQLDDDMALSWDDYTCRFMWTGSAEERSISQERQAVLSAMTDEGEYTPKDLALILGRPVTSVNKSLLHLFNDRFVEKTGFGKYVKVMKPQTYGLRVQTRPSVQSLQSLQSVQNTDEAVSNSAGGGPTLQGSGLPPAEFVSGVGMRQNGLQNGNSAGSAGFSPPPTKAADFDHDQRRLTEVQAALLIHDFKTARRAAAAIRGRKTRDGAEETIDTSEAEHQS